MKNKQFVKNILWRKGKKERAIQYGWWKAIFLQSRIGEQNLVFSSGGGERVKLFFPAGYKITYAEGGGSHSRTERRKKRDCSSYVGHKQVVKRVPAGRCANYSKQKKRGEGGGNSLFLREPHSTESKVPPRPSSYIHDKRGGKGKRRGATGDSYRAP